MANFTAGTSFSDGVTNDVTAAKLNALVADAVPTSNLSLNSTTGTIATFNSTTPTFLGAITASTNTIDVGSGQIYKDATGAVGIGTTSPARKLSIVSETADSQLTIGSTAPSISLTNNPSSPNAGSKTAIFALATAASNYSLGDGDAILAMLGNSRGDLYLNANYQGTGTKNIILQPSTGNVGIGTTSPATKLSVVASSNSGINVTNGTMTGIFFNSSDTSIAIGTQTNHPVALYSNNTERLRIDSSGNVCVNRTSGDGKFNTDGAVYFYNFTAGVGNSTIKYNSASGQLFYDTSSLRYKKNIRDSSYGLDSVTKMRSVQYEYKDSNYSDVGIIAEELEAIIPELVGKNADGQPESVLYDRLTSVLIKAVQELKTENDSLKSRIEALEAK